MTLLHIEGAHKRYGEHTALRGLDLCIAHGELVCLLGASGSGKTTLLRIVAGLERVDGGRVVLAGEVVDAPGMTPLPPQRRGLGMVFQDYALWPHLSALDNVALPLRARRRGDAAVDARRMLERVGLGAQALRRPHELSGGQQQRVALARALAVRPRLLLCDEPLSNLDAALREELRELIGSVVREHGLAALYITHDQREALALGDRVGIVEAGRLLQIDTPQALLRAPASESAARFLHACGPWPAYCDGAGLSLPWGRMPAPAGAPRGDCRVYWRASALRAAADVAADVAADAAAGAGSAATAPRARVLGCVETADGVELRCALADVVLRLRVATPLALGAELALSLDPRQALLYPAFESNHTIKKENLVS